MKNETHISAFVHDIKQKLLPALKHNEQLCEQYAWWILEAITQCDQTKLILQQSIQLTPQQQATLDTWLDKIIHENMPIQYLIGSVPFNAVEILVEPPVLIPRPETEEWTANLIHTLHEAHAKALTLLDLCCGSGCIAITLAHALPSSTIYAVDNADHAIALTKKNIVHNGIRNIVVMDSDLFTSIPDDMLFDLIVSNPPYIARDAWQKLDLSVTTWEDPHALVAEHAGLAIIERIIKESRQYIKPNQTLAQHGLPNLMIEIGFDQGEAVAQLFQDAGYIQVKIHKDLEGKDRVVSGRIEDVATADYT